MKSILEEFAYGNISPEAQTLKRDSAYGKAMNALVDCEKKLLEKLNAEDKALFEKCIDAQCEVNAQTAVKNLIYGYKLGVLMTAEVFVTEL